MPLDPRLILAAAPPAAAPVDVFGSLQRGLGAAYQMRGNEQQLQVQQLQLDAAQRAEFERQNLGQAIRGTMTTDPTTGQQTPNLPGALAQAYTSSRDPLALFKVEQDYTKGQVDNRKTLLEAHKAKLEGLQKQNEFVSGIANGALYAVQQGADPQVVWSRAVSQVAQAGLPTQNLPPTYDEGLLRQYAASTLKMSEALQAQQKVVDQQLAERRIQLEGRTESRLERAEGRQERADVRAETKARREEREAAEEVPRYTGDSTLNSHISRLMQERGLTGRPPPDVLALAQQRVLEGETAKAGATGAEAARIAAETKPLSGEAAKTIAELTALQQMTDDAADLFDPAYTGQLEGRWGATREWTGKAGEKEVVFRRLVADMKDQLLRARSGAAITPSEYARLSTMVPNVTDEDSVFQAKLLGFRRALDQAKAARLEAETTGRGQLQRQQPGVTPLPGGGGAATAPSAGKKRVPAAMLDTLARERANAQGGDFATAREAIRQELRNTGQYEVD